MFLDLVAEAIKKNHAMITGGYGNSLFLIILIFFDK